MILMMNAHGFSWVYDEVRIVRFGDDNFVRFLHEGTMKEEYFDVLTIYSDNMKIIDQIIIDTDKGDKEGK